MTATIEVTKIEEQAKGRLLFNVRANTAEARIDFPIGIQRLETPVLDEAAVLRSTLQFAEELTAALRLRLPPEPVAPERRPEASGARLQPSAPAAVNAGAR
jgi:hypothetical protein